ncbi:MAG TPA: hypothetical protein VGM56_30325 [Byssovorax sp.]|jgi:hypothetical protein
MNPITMIARFALTLSVLASAAGCAATDEPEKSGYGYEFATETVSASPTQGPRASAAPDVKENGRLAPEGIERKLFSGYGAMLACHAGRGAEVVTLRFVIADDGQVTEIGPLDEAATAAGDPALNACVAHVVDGLAFSPSDGGPITVQLPLAFAR